MHISQRILTTAKGKVTVQNHLLKLIFSSLFFSKFVSRSAPAPIAIPTPTAEMKSYAPDNAPSGDTTKVLCFVQGFSNQPDNQYSCMIDGIEIPVKVPHLSNHNF